MRGGRRAAPGASLPLDRPPRSTVASWLLPFVLLWPALGQPDDSEEDDAPEIDARVLVEAAVDADSAHRDPGAATVIDVDPDALPPSASVADVLDDVAGVTIRRFGGPGDPAFVRIRGSTAQQVAVYVDGVPLNAHGSAAIDLSELDVAAYDRIEVHRSAAPAGLGAAPIGGVVHLRTRPDVAAPLRIRAGYGSFGTHSLSGGGGIARTLRDGALGNVRFSLALDGTRGDFPAFLDGGTLYDASDDRVARRTNNHLDQVDAGVQARLVKGSIDLTVRDRLLVRGGGVPGPSGTAVRRARLGVVDNLLAGRGQARLDRARLIGDLSWRLRAERYSDPDDEVGLGAQERRDLLQEGAAGISAEITPIDGVTVLPSARLDLHTITPRTLLPAPATDATRVRLASTFALSTPLERGALAVIPTLRIVVLDDRLLGSAPFAQGTSTERPRVRVEPLPQIAVAVYPSPALTVRAAAARGFRPPSFSELFGDRGSIIGNPTLLPETAWSVEESGPSPELVKMCSPQHIEIYIYIQEKIIFF